MTPARQWLTPILVLLCLVLMISLARQSLTLHELRTDLREQDLALVKIRERIERMTRENTILVAQLRAADKAKAAGDTGEPKADPTNQTVVDLSSYFRKDPDYARLRRELELRNQVRQYGNLSLLNLPPDKLEKLRDLLVDRDRAPSDAAMAARDQGISPDSPDFGRAIGNATNEVNSEIRALVGDNVYQQLDANINTANVRGSLVAQFGSDLTASGISISADQINSLAQAEIQANKDPNLNSSEAKDQATLRAAVNILTPEQLAIFQQDMTVDEEVRQMQLRVLAAAQKDYGNAQPFRWTFP